MSGRDFLTSSLPLRLPFKARPSAGWERRPVQRPILALPHPGEPLSLLRSERRAASNRISSRCLPATPSSFLFALQRRSVNDVTRAPPAVDPRQRKTTTQDTTFSQESSRPEVVLRSHHWGPVRHATQIFKFISTAPIGTFKNLVPSGDQSTCPTEELNCGELGPIIEC